MFWESQFQPGLIIEVARGWLWHVQILGPWMDAGLNWLGVDSLAPSGVERKSSAWNWNRLWLNWNCLGGCIGLTLDGSGFYQGGLTCGWFKTTVKSPNLNRWRRANHWAWNLLIFVNWHFFKICTRGRKATLRLTWNNWELHWDWLALASG